MLHQVQEVIKISILMVSSPYRIRKGFKELNKLVKSPINYQMAKEDKLFYQLEVENKVFHNLNLIFKKDIQHIKIKVLHKFH